MAEDHLQRRRQIKAYAVSAQNDSIICRPDSQQKIYDENDLKDDETLDRAG